MTALQGRRPPAQRLQHSQEHQVSQAAVGISGSIDHVTHDRRASQVCMHNMACMLPADLSL
jgi:hypothetical protein